ncbi:MAG: gas vesicle structural protein GvpA [Actinomycetota bacterium]|nr:gas vesicle structural protein GvpA [Actinomycetota bacterium]
MTVATHSVNRAPRPSSLADVLEVVLDKGIVIDAYVRVAVVGIELLTIDARIVIASVDTYLRFAEAVNRLDLNPDGQVSGLPGMMEEITEGGASSRTRGALSGAADKARDAMSSLTVGHEEEPEERPRRRPAKKTSARRPSSAGSTRRRRQEG